MSECILCDRLRVDDDTHGVLCDTYAAAPQRALRSHGAPAVARALAERSGLSVSPEQVWRHFAHHRARPIAPGGRLVRERAFTRAEDLSPRQRTILALVGRLGVLSASQLTRVAYRPHARSDASARAACHRDLGVLIRGGYLARTPLPARLRRAERGRGPLMLIHPGRESLPYLQYHGIEARPTARLDGNDLMRAVRWHAAHEIVVALAGHLGPLDPAHWQGPADIALRVDGRDARLRPDSVVARPNTSHLFIRLDDGAQDDIDLIAELALLPHARSQAGAAPRWLVLCPGATRVAALEDALARRLAVTPPALHPQVWATDALSRAAGVWRRLDARHGGTVADALGSGEVLPHAAQGTYTRARNGTLPRPTPTPA